MVLTVKQVAGDDAGGLLAQECSPRGGGPPWGWVQLVAVERGTDRGGRDLHAESKELALDALVAPARVLLGQADDQLVNVGIQVRPARCTMGMVQAPAISRRCHRSSVCALSSEDGQLVAQDEQLDGAAQGQAGESRQHPGWLRSGVDDSATLPS